MKQILLESIITGTASLILALLVIPVLSRHSVKLGLMDKPNHRKVHIKPVPVVGGIAVTISTILALLAGKTAWQLLIQYPVIIGGSLLLFVTGIWDDRKNVRPLYRLVIQILCAWGIAAGGIRISSLYGFMGMYEINTTGQYLLTILIITGVTNAFNLMDGIDGLAGGLAFINLVVLGVLSLLLNQYAVFILLVTLAAAILAFLKNNIHPAKVFMGDGGSLMLGFIMSSIGILLIETTNKVHTIESSKVVLIVSAILVIPVFDSLRVYAGRIRRGESPFKADKTHLHHLFLVLGLNHRKAAFYIYGLEIIIIILGAFLHRFATISFCVLVLVGVFLFVSQLLAINSGVDKWTRTIRKMEDVF